jgi:hypothetical protein
MNRHAPLEVVAARETREAMTLRVPQLFSCRGVMVFLWCSFVVPLSG